MKARIGCFIPARSGSKRIKNKNISRINNEPLIKFVSKKIIDSKKINEFHIGTDNNKIFSKIGSLKKKFHYFKRSKKSSKDTAPSEWAIIEFLKANKKIDIVVFVQVTNPFIKSKYIDKAISIFLKNKYDSLLSVTESKHFLWKMKKYAKPINYDYKKRTRSQNTESYFIENGSFYIFYRKNFLRFKNRLHGKIGIYKMPTISSHEIDNKNDLIIIKKLLRK